MTDPIKAIFEDGVLKPLEPLGLAEHEQVQIVIIKDELKTSEILRLARAGRSFDFLDQPGEDIYTIRDGEPV